MTDLKNLHASDRVRVPAISANRWQAPQQLAAVEVRIEDVLRDLKAIAHTDLQTLAEQSVVPARWVDKLKALELPMKHLGLVAPETHQNVHQHVHFPPEQFQLKFLQHHG